MHRDSNMQVFQMSTHLRRCSNAQYPKFEFRRNYSGIQYCLMHDLHTARMPVIVDVLIETTL